MPKNPSTEKTRRRVYEVLVEPSPEDRLARIIAFWRMMLILLSVAAITVFSATEQTSLGAPLKIFLIIAVSVFTVEYVLKLWSATAGEKYQRPVTGRVALAVTPWRVLELLTILPFFVLLLFNSLLGLEALPLRLLYIFQLLLVFRLARTRHAFDLMIRAWQLQKTGLAIALIGLWFLMLIAAALLHVAENEAQPDVFGSIGASMYWAAITLTAVGYGDVVPITIVGKVLAGMIAILGISAFAIPTGLIITGFAQAKRELEGEASTCPMCGKEHSASSNPKSGA